MPSEFTIFFGFATVHFKFAQCNFTSFIPYTFKFLDFTHHALCSTAKKSEQTYSKFLKVITSVSDNEQQSRILLDFERAAVNAFTSAIPESSIVGCYFHLCQAFLRKVNELGLKKTYENNCGLSLALRLIPTLSFVPTDLVEQSFESVIEEIEHVVDRLDLEQSLSDKIDELA